MPTPKAERNLVDIRTLAEALARALHDSARGSDVVAEEIGCRRAYLADALNPHREEVHFQAARLVAFCRATHSVLPVAWLADQLGYVLVPRAQATQGRDLALDETLDVTAQAGALSTAVREAYDDGRLTDQERSDIRECAHRVQREAAEVERAVSTSPISLQPRVAS